MKIQRVCSKKPSASLTTSRRRPRLTFVARNFQAAPPNNNGIKVEILQGGNVVRVIDTKTEHSIDIEAGEYRLRLMEGNPNVVLTENKLSLQRGEREIVSITQNPNRSKIQPSLAKPIIGNSSVARQNSNLRPLPSPAPVFLDRARPGKIRIKSLRLVGGQLLVDSRHPLLNSRLRLDLRLLPLDSRQPLLNSLLRLDLRLLGPIVGWGTLADLLSVSWARSGKSAQATFPRELGLSFKVSGFI